ncbi:MAG TPA: alpha/beta hydrolase [Thermomicrobiaceae bacterium]|nr:alpha/beta hydrolase [Thermomicrobiaceae bacterium]
MNVRGAETDRALALPDGRTLAYSDLGDPDGHPCLFFHGIPGSRRQPGLIAGVAAAARLRVIGIDRPGYGGSTFQRGRRLLDWPRDVSRLADALGLRGFSVVGLSGGAGYALACAAAMPERVAAAVVLSGMGPLDDPAMGPMIGELSRGLRAGARLARRMPRVAARLLARGVARDAALPDPIGRWASQMAPADRALLARPEVARALLDDLDETMRGGPIGMAWDLTLCALPWGFQLAEITTPVLLWHGEDDWNVPPAFGRGLALALRNCRAWYWPGEGHLASLSHADEVVAALSATLAS